MVSEGTGIIGEPLRQSTWEFVCPALLGARLMAQNCSMPQYAIDAIPIHHFNEHLKIAGAPNINDVSFEVRDVLAPSVFEQAWDWFKSGYNPETGVVGYASEYKKTGSLLLYDTKGIQVREWQLIGLWIMNINQGNGDYTSKDPLIPQLQFSADRAIPIFNR